MKEMDFVITIADRKQGERFMGIFQEHGMPIILGAFGRGTASRETLDFFGLEATEKAVMFNLAPKDEARALMKDVRRRLRLDLPGNGIMVSVPVSSIAGQLAKVISEKFPEGEESEKNMDTKMDYQLIIAIANAGYTEIVMDAARAAGARGGTSIHAKGVGLETVKKFFGVSIASEKEMIFIVTRNKDKAPIMKAILKEAGVSTKAGAVVFALPVSEVGGISAFELSDEEEA